MSPLELVEASVVEEIEIEADARVEPVPYSVRLMQRRIGRMPAVARDDSSTSSESSRASSRDDRRAHPRHSGPQLDWVRVARLKRGDAVTLVDLSAGGALLETDVALKPGTTLTLEIIGTDVEATVPIKVLRCFVTNLRGETTTYRGACAFNRLFELPVAHAPTAPSAADFVGTEAALNYLLERYTSDGEKPAETDPRITLERSQVLHVLDSLHARATSDTLDPDGHHAAGLLGAVLPALHRGAPRQSVLAALEEQVRRLPDGWQSRLQATSLRLISLIDLCSAQEAVVPAVAAEENPAPEPAASEDDEAASAASLQKIVVRYADGRIVKGYTQDFHPTRPRFSLWPSMKAAASDRVVVPVAHLKAVFFVRNFKGNASHKERKTFAKVRSGRRIEVTFLDNEVVVGTTLNYRADAQGFFVVPADQTANNRRMFVVSSAVRRVRFA